MRLSTTVLHQMAESITAEPRAIDGRERRREARTRFAGQALIIRCGKEAARKPLIVAIRDLSAHGIGITYNEPLKVGERFILILPRGMAQLARAVLCSVVNTRPSASGGFDIGATFTALIRIEGSTKPQTTATSDPSLPVERVITSFRAQPNDAPSKEEITAIRSLELVGERATAPSGPPGPSSHGTAGAGKPTGAAATGSPAAPPMQWAGGELPRLMTREQCIQRAEQTMQARTLSGVVAQVISLAASPRSDLAELASLVARDPMLSARVLQAANSASYTSTRGIVSTIPEAVRNIGCATVRNIAASVGVFDAMPTSQADGFNPIRCWQHSFGVATLCQRLAPEAESGLAYLVGLCHDLGEILFHSHFGPEYREVLEVQAATGKPRDQLERVMLGIAHSELVMTILRCTALPQAICTPIEEFHAAGMAGRAPGNPLARVLRLAEPYANGVLLASSGQSPIMSLSRPECRTATGREEPERPDGVCLRSEIFALTGLLARLSAKDEAELMTPLYPTKRVRVLLVRDPSLSPFDPIQAALECLCEVAVQPRLPSGPELNGFSGIVIVARSTSAGGFTGPEITTSVRDVLPTLWLAGRIDGGTTSGALAPIAYPVPLSRVSEFVQALSIAA